MSPSHTTADLLSRLIRFDTTNPPGSEGECVRFLEGLLRDAGLSTELLKKSADRPNLVARLPGRGEAPPLLLYGHADVVTTAGQTWSRSPFAGEVIDGWVWGRGALDMKGGLAMMTSALVRAHEEGLRPAGDVVFAVLADEEAGGTDGARFLVERHPDAFEGIRYALGEFGGFPLYIDGRRFYMIQVAEKHPCWLEAKISGPAGHGARPMRGGAMADLGRLLVRLDRLRTPIHVTPVVRTMIESMTTALPLPARFVLRRLLHPRWTDRMLARLGETGRNLEPLFRNTVNATMVRGGEKPNVIPSEIAVGLDARLLPGYTLDDLLAELRPALGGAPDIDVRLYNPGPREADLGLVDFLGRLLREAEPDAVPIPYLLPGSSDARFLSRLGIQTYGFTPMNLPAEFNFFDTIHAADERVPAEAVAFGANVLYRLIERYSGAPTGTG